MRAFCIACMLMVGAIFAGCERVEVETRVEKVPKQPRPIMAVAPSGGKAHWAVPEGWTPIPAGQMRLAAFQVSQQYPDVLVTVVPLAGDGGGLLPNINRWAGQIGLPATDEQGLAKLVTRTEIGGHQVQLLDMTGPESANPRPRMLVAIVPHEGQTYYFKLAGRADVVSAQKANFDEFVNSIHFDGPGGHEAAPVTKAAPTAQSAETPAQTEELTYQTPQGWTKDPPLPLRIVSFQIGQGERRAEVIVSKLPATGSGSRDQNITRWRGQVGLPPLPAGQPQPSTPLTVGGVDSALFDLVGPGESQPAKRQLLAWVPKGEDWWFFKLIGPSDVVGQQQANFDAFVKSVKFAEPKL